MRKLRSLIRGLKNLWFYRSVVWNDRWYDYSFMLLMWERKLQNMANNWKNSHYVGSENDEKDIRKALLLIRVLINEDFDMSAAGEKKKKEIQEELFNVLKGYEKWWD